MCAHPAYNKQQRNADRTGSSEAAFRQIDKTYAAYITADLAFRQSSSPAAAAAGSLQLNDSDVHQTTTIYELDPEATARIDNAIQLDHDQQHTRNSSVRLKQSISK